MTSFTSIFSREKVPVKVTIVELTHLRIIGANKNWPGFADVGSLICTL